MLLHRLTLAVLACVAVSITAAAAPRTDPAVVYEQRHRAVVAYYGLYGDAAVREYVSAIGAELAEHAERALDYTFTVLDTDLVNAFAAPGGYIYVTRGLMAYLNSEAQLAAVLGHELGHIEEEHPERQETAQRIVGKVTGDIGARAGNYKGAMAAGVVGTALVMGYGRDMELEADRYGAELLAKVGYDPGAMIDVITVLKDQELFSIERAKADGYEASVYHGIFSSHPDNDTRLQELIAGARSLVDEDNRRDAGQQRYLDVIDGMVWGADASQGLIRGDSFYHPELGIVLSFPEDWNVDNNPTELVLTAPGDEAVMIIRAIPRGTKRKDRKIKVDDFLQKKAGLTRWQNPRTFESNGLPVFTAVEPEGDSPFGTRLVRVAAVLHGDLGYVFSGSVSDEARQYKFDSHFDGIVRSLRDITPTERSRMRSYTLSVQTAANGTSIASLAAASPVDSYAEQTLRLLNGLYPESEPADGALIKVIQ